MLNLPDTRYISLPHYQYNSPHHPTLFMSHKAEGTEYVFSFFSVKSQIEGFLYCLSLSICNQKIRKTWRKRERGGGWGGEVGWSLIARSERNLCVWSRALCMLACQPGDFSFCVWKHACSFFFAHTVEGKCGCLAGTAGWKIGIYGFQTNPFCLYLLTSIPKRQLEGLELVSHATVDGGAVVVYFIILLGDEIIPPAMLHLVTMKCITDAFYKYNDWL